MRTLQQLHRDGWFIPADDSEGLWDFWAVEPPEPSAWDNPPPRLRDGKFLLVRRGLCVPVELDHTGSILAIGGEVRSVRELPDGIWRLRRYLREDDPALE